MGHRQKVASGSVMFAYSMYSIKNMKLKLTNRQPLNSKWIRPINKDGKFHKAYMGQLHAAAVSVQTKVCCVASCKFNN